MISLGQMNRLHVHKRGEEGWILLSDDEMQSLLLPFADAPAELEVGQSLHAFVYKDSAGELVATTARPKAMVGQLALLKAKQNGPYGTFFDWGLRKDLLVSKRGQREEIEPGDKCLIYVYVDDDERLSGTAKYHRFIDQERHAYRDGDEVHLTITDETPLGFNAIVDYKFSALLYKDQIFRPVKFGDQLKGYIRQVREDGLLDVSTQKPGYGKVPELAEKILQILEKRGGELDISDKSTPERIKKQFNCSKKAFKQAIGALKKENLIEIQPELIKLK